MNLDSEVIYHIYNRGNNQQKVFFNDENYRYFLNKAKINMSPFVDIIAYCLMPNHFHFLVYTQIDFFTDKFSDKFKHFLSSYTRAINNQEGRTGSLFQQNSKAKAIDKPGYGIVCFNYIHQNPIRSSLVEKIEDWRFSSFNEYLGLTESGICNRALATELLDLPHSPKELYELSYGELDKAVINNLF